MNKDIIIEVAKYLDLNNLAKLFLLNKEYYLVLKSNLLWKILCEKLIVSEGSKFPFHNYGILYIHSINNLIKMYHTNEYYHIYKKYILGINPESSKIKILSLTNIPKEKIKYLHSIYELSKLQHLTITDTKYLTISKNIDKLINLKSIKINYCEIKELIYEISNLINLEEIDMSHNKIENIYCNFSEMIKLGKLNLSFNLIKSLPESFCKLKNLEDLQLNNNLIYFIQNNISKLKKLKSVDLSHNKLTNFPNGITQSINLNLLNISYNDINLLPETILFLNNLKILYISNNHNLKITKIVATFLMNKCTFVDIFGYIYKSNGLSVHDQKLSKNKRNKKNKIDKKQFCYQNKIYKN